LQDHWEWNMGHLRPLDRVMSVIGLAMVLWPLLAG
jgi:hypothetical protein